MSEIEDMDIDEVGKFLDERLKLGRKGIRRATVWLVVSVAALVVVLFGGPPWLVLAMVLPPLVCSMYALFVIAPKDKRTNRRIDARLKALKRQTDLMLTWPEDFH